MPRWTRAMFLYVGGTEDTSANLGVDATYGRDILHYNHREGWARLTYFSGSSIAS